MAPSPEPGPEDPVVVVLRLSQLEEEARRRDEERTCEHFRPATTDEDEQRQLTDVARESDSFFNYLSEEEEGND